MRLSARILDNVHDINTFKVVSEAHLSDSGPNSMHIQLIDLSKDGIRYMSQATVYSVSLIFPDLNDDEEFEIAASQPFSDDRSIWKAVFSSSQIPWQDGQ